MCFYGSHLYFMGMWLQKYFSEIIISLAGAVDLCGVLSLQRNEQNLPWRQCH
jgi:hypothetical protein